jgi:hypothetical protein
VWRDEPQHRISRVIKGSGIRPDGERTARAACVALAVSGTADVVDAIVVATAVQYRAAVVPSDPGDLNHLADSIGVKLRLFTV